MLRVCTGGGRGPPGWLYPLLSPRGEGVYVLGGGRPFVVSYALPAPPSATVFCHAQREKGRSPQSSNLNRMHTSNTSKHSPDALQGTKAECSSFSAFVFLPCCNLGQFHPINFSRNCPGAFSTTNARPRQMPCPSPPLSEDGFRGAWSEGEGEGLKAPRTPPFPSQFPSSGLVWSGAFARNCLPLLLRSHPGCLGFPFCPPPPFLSGHRVLCYSIAQVHSTCSLVVAASFLRLPPLHVLPHRVLVKRSTKNISRLIHSPAQQVNKARSSRRTRTCLLPTKLMFSGFRRLTPFFKKVLLCCCCCCAQLLTPLGGGGAHILKSWKNKAKHKTDCHSLSLYV